MKSYGAYYSQSLNNNCNRVTDPTKNAYIIHHTHHAFSAKIILLPIDASTFIEIAVYVYIVQKRLSADNVKNMRQNTLRCSSEYVFPPYINVAIY